MNDRTLANRRCEVMVGAVHAEGRALLGSNPSAEVDSDTVGFGGFGHPGRPPAGSVTKRKIPAVLGQRLRVVPHSNHNRNPGVKVRNEFLPTDVSR
jgi:hypothetical protein